jgi:tetratricopeptide (TPR) repeat protein
LEQLQHFQHYLLEEGKQAHETADYPTALKKWEQGLILARKTKNQQAVGVFLGNISILYSNLGQYPKALTYFQQALTIHREIGDKRVVGNTLKYIGIVYRNLYQYQKALNYFQQALTIHREIDDKYGEWTNLSNIGNEYKNLGQYQKALTYFQQALTISSEISDKRWAGNNLNNIGVMYSNLGQYQKALAYYQQALTIHREFSDRRGEGTNLSNIGNEYKNLGQYQKALTYFQQALTISSEISDKRWAGNNLNNIGVMYSNLGQYQKALSYYQQALEIRREIGDRREEGIDLGNIGTMYINLSQYQKALNYYQQALEIDREIGNKHGEGAKLRSIGVVYKNLGQYQKALSYYQQALTIHRKISNKYGEGTNLGNIGLVYYNLGQYQKALSYFQQALEIRREIVDKHGEGIDLNNIGSVKFAKGQYKKALSYYQQSLIIDRKIGNKRGEGFGLGNIGVVYKYLGKYQQSKDAFQDSVSILETVGTGNLWTAQRGLAFAEAKLNQSDAAIQHYEQALDNIEKLRAGITEKEHKISFMRDKIVVYDELIALLQSLHSDHPKKGYDRKAFETFERKQGRLVLEEMGESGARRFSGLDNEIIEAEQSLTLKWQQAQSLSPQEYTALEQEEEQLKARIRAEYPKYYALKYPQPVDLATLQKQVLQNGEMMLVYGVLHRKIERKTVLWVIGKQDFQMFTLPVDEDTLKQEVAQLRGYLSDSTFSSQFPPPSLHLYQTLLPKAVRQLIKSAKILYIVPTGPLYGLPFGSLVTFYEARREIHYLIEDYAISYLSSASLLKTLRCEKRKTQPPEPFLAFADPEYPPCGVGDDKAETLAQLRTESYLKSTKGGCFNRLAATADEVREIANLFNADHSEALYLGAKANRSTMFALNDKQELDDYRYVMFSVHGVIPNKINQIEQPALVLSNPLTEGYLTMADAFALTLNADFVNLSACNTGCAGESCSENVRGEGIMGLTRAFMYAGTSRVAVTLWSVNLYSAKEFSIGLFTHLKAKKKMAHALREIKLKMIQGKASNRKYANPYHWAAFVVYGDGQ